MSSSDLEPRSGRSNSCRQGAHHLAPETRCELVKNGQGHLAWLMGRPRKPGSQDPGQHAGPLGRDHSPGLARAAWLIFVSAFGELFFKPPKPKSEYSRKSIPDAENRDSKVRVGRGTLPQLRFLPVLQPQPLWVPEVSNFPLVICIRGSSQPVLTSVLHCSLLLSATAWCISIEGGS